MCAFRRNKPPEDFGRVYRLLSENPYKKFTSNTVHEELKYLGIELNAIRAILKYGFEHSYFKIVDIKNVGVSACQAAYQVTESCLESSRYKLLSQVSEDYLTLSKFGYDEGLLDQEIKGIEKKLRNQGIYPIIAKKDGTMNFLRLYKKEDLVHAHEDLILDTSFKKPAQQIDQKAESTCENKKDKNTESIIEDLLSILRSNQDSSFTITELTEKTHSYRQLVAYYLKKLNKEGEIEKEKKFNKELNCELLYYKIKNPETEAKKVESSKEGTKRQVLALLNKDINKVYTSSQISKEINKYTEQVQTAIREGRKEGKIKVVGFKFINGHRYICVQDIQGPDDPVALIDSTSEESKKLNLISLKNYCNGDLKKKACLDAIIKNTGLEGFNVSTSGGYYVWYKKEDLLKLEESNKQLFTIDSTSSMTHQAAPSIVKSTKKGVTGFKKVLNFFRKFELNIDISINKKETLADLDQDSIEF